MNCTNIVTGCEIILCDIAGTTTSIPFVKDVLFKYAVKNVEQFLKLNWEQETVKKAVKLLKEDPDFTEIVNIFKNLTKKNDSNEGLKILHGLIYKDAYEKENLKAHVFPDVASCFKKWAQTKKIAIYSTGNVESQKLLFSHSVEGDLSPLIVKYFDLSIGPKTLPGSYEKIANELNVTPDKILYLTDCLQELKAAKNAGCMVMLVSRPGNANSFEEYKREFIITSFEEISVQ